jgi:nicotinate-nucleotide adenylyltransferase
MKIGLYFGSFNPIHTGHLIIANHVLNETALQRIWFVVSPQNPFKQSSTLLNEYDRLHLAQMAVQKDDRLKASEIEFSLPKPSYTAHTLTYLSEKYPTHQFSVVMGSDSYQNLHKWKNVETIIDNYPIIVYRRPGFDVPPKAVSSISILEAPLLEISATLIRECILQGKSIRYMVPEAVEEEIQKSSFYKRNHNK